MTPSELTRDPRARRAASTALARGLDVVGLSGRISGEPAVPLDGVRIVRVGRPGRIKATHERGLPPRRATLVRELRGVLRLARLGRRTVELWRGGRSVGHVDVVHANDLDTLPAGWLLARRSRARLVYDAHELYSEFDPHPSRLYRAAATGVEAVLARRAAAVATVNEPLAGELVRRLGLRREPQVVLNVPELDPHEPAAPEPSAPLRAVYQGALGPGRPLDDLLRAVEAAPNVELGVRVVRFGREELEAEIAAAGLAERVTVLDAVPPGGVLEGLRGFDVGVIFDRPLTRNSELSLPNKLFEYLMAGLAVVVPRLPGLARLVEEDGVGLTFEPGEPRSLGAALETLAADRQRLADLRASARRAAVERYNAEAQAERLAELWGA
jgi:glycosyltransferase involved in cell wall biosynthesis